ncbi:MAG: UDP-2,3-diacylglucosamine diphosphatase [Desulfuromonadaceae bacterium]|nr:UDP-2,3-diacylglucosamine diphosphatase [Desulfuromonadaceae bacterium]
MKDIFIADAHLKHAADKHYIQLLEFLKQNRGKIRTLILLGDIFEFWVGYRHCVYSAYVPLLQQLSLLQQGGTRIIMVEGNHDFNVGPYFSETLRAKIIPTGDVVILGETKVWLEHGDLINPNKTYRWLRKLFRSRGARILSRIIHPDLLWSIAEHLGNWSKQQRTSMSTNLGDGCSLSAIPQEHLLSLAATHSTSGCDALVCGHFHRSWHKKTSHTEALVVGEWRKHGTYAEHQDGRFELKQFCPPTEVPPDQPG